MAPVMKRQSAKHRAEGRRAPSGARSRGLPARLGVTWLTLVFLTAVLVLLCAPRLGLGYFWDDYIFLTSARQNPLAFVLPNPTTIFYRPISMGIYFLPLVLLGSSGAIVGHVLNLLLLAACVLLLASLASKVAGPRAGLLAGFAFASLAAMPALVAWVTNSQDILAILFLLIAFHYRLAGRVAETTIAAACAAFSKETALALFPALLVAPWILRRSPHRLRLQGALLGGVALVWAAVHPGVRAFLQHGIRSEATGYVHLQDPGQWPVQGLRYLLLLVHAPITSRPVVWPEDLLNVAVAAVAVLVVGAWIGLGGASRPAQEPASLPRTAALAGLMALPLPLDVVLIGHVAPYYTCLPGIGFTLVLGALLSRLPRPVSVVVLAGFLLMGVRSRGIETPDQAFTEANMVHASEAIRTVEKRFQESRATVPRGTELLISVGATGTLGVNQTIQQGQAPRLWYHDPTLVAHQPERMEGRRSELLFRLTSDLTVVAIEPRSLDYRWTGDIEPGLNEIGGCIRAYVRGAAACGRTDHALQVLDSLSSVMPESLRIYNRHLRAMVLLAAGRRAEAESILARTASFDPELTARMMRKLLREPTGRAAMDTTVYRAFGMSRAVYAETVTRVQEEP